MYCPTTRSSAARTSVVQSDCAVSSSNHGNDRHADQRDAEDFAELLGKYQLQLLGYIYASLHNMDDAEDVYQQSCIVMWRKFDEYQAGSYQVGSDFLKWACTIARYEVLNFIRSSKHRPRYFSDDYLQHVAELPTEDDTEHVAARQQALHGCMRRLRQRDQQLVVRCYCETGKI